MRDRRPSPDAVSAAQALPLALRELDLAVEQGEYVANRANVANLTLTVEIPGSLPRHFRLTNDERTAALAFLPRFSAARVEAAQEKVRALTARVTATTGPG